MANRPQPRQVIDLDSSDDEVTPVKVERRQNDPEAHRRSIIKKTIHHHKNPIHHHEANGEQSEEGSDDSSLPDPFAPPEATANVVGCAKGSMIGAAATTSPTLIALAIKHGNPPSKSINRRGKKRRSNTGGTSKKKEQKRG